MGDTGSERSKPPAIPPRCPCGFWGSSKTMNLCSKCFADVQKKQPDEDCPPEPEPSPSNNQSSVFCSETNSSSSQSLLLTPVNPETPLQEESSAAHHPTQDEASGLDANHTPLAKPTKRPCDSSVESQSEESPEKRARVAAPSPSASTSPAPSEDPEAVPANGPLQKNRRRCYLCQSKLGLVQQELGSCRCGYVFCPHHRLPEQHDCLFDHKDKGRQDAKLNMVKLDRKLGRSCQRIGEECS